MFMLCDEIKMYLIPIYLCLASGAFILEQGASIPKVDRISVMQLTCLQASQKEISSKIYRNRNK